MGRKTKVLLVGKKSMKDYVGAKSIYVFNALNEAGIAAFLYNIEESVDPPPGCTHLIYLPWVNTINKGWVDFIERLNLPNRILYTDNWFWYEECRNEFNRREQVDFDSVFSTIAFTTSENMMWWPKARFEMWGGLVDEDMAVPKEPKNYIFVDEIWPDDWSKDQYTAKYVLDIAIPRIKEKTKCEIVTQKRDPEWSNPPWADEVIDPDQDLPTILDYLAKSQVYITSHEEALGWMQLESQVCGVPVVTNNVFSKHEIFETGDGCTFLWNWGEKEDEEGSKEIDIDPEKAANSLVEAVDRALNTSNRKHIRESAIERYGKSAWVKRTQLKID